MNNTKYVSYITFEAVSDEKALEIHKLMLETFCNDNQIKLTYDTFEMQQRSK